MTGDTPHLWRCVLPIGQRLQRDLTERLKDSGVTPFVQVFARSENSIYQCFYPWQIDNIRVPEAIKNWLTLRMQQAAFQGAVINALKSDGLWNWGMQHGETMVSTMRASADANMVGAALPFEVLLSAACRADCEPVDDTPVIFEPLKDVTDRVSHAIADEYQINANTGLLRESAAIVELFSIRLACDAAVENCELNAVTTYAQYLTTKVVTFLKTKWARSWVEPVKIGQDVHGKVAVIGISDCSAPAFTDAHVKAIRDCLDEHGRVAAATLVSLRQLRRAETVAITNRVPAGEWPAIGWTDEPLRSTSEMIAVSIGWRQTILREMADIETLSLVSTKQLDVLAFQWAFWRELRDQLHVLLSVNHLRIDMLGKGRWHAFLESHGFNEVTEPYTYRDKIGQASWHVHPSSPKLRVRGYAKFDDGTVSNPSGFSTAVKAANKVLEKCVAALPEIHVTVIDRSGASTCVGTPRAHKLEIAFK